MAQTVTVVLSCDPCAAAGKEVEGETYVVGIDGVWYAVEECAKHNVRGLDPIRAYVAQHARVIDKQNLNHLLKMAHGDNVRSLPSRRPASVTAAPAQLESVAASNGRAGRKTTLPRRNACPFPDCPNAKYTSTTALLNHLETIHGISGSMGEVFGLDCPLCGSDGSPKLGFHLQYGVHKKSRPTVSEAFAQAKAKGDKHEVVARVYERLGVPV